MAQLLDSNEIFFTPFEPKVANRFIMFIEGIPAYLVRKASRPTVTFEEIILDHINVQRKIKGKATWSDVTVELYDPVVPSAAQAVMEWVRLHHESVKGAYIGEAALGEMDWSTQDPMAISLTLKYDYAILQF